MKKLSEANCNNRLVRFLFGHKWKYDHRMPKSRACEKCGKTQYWYQEELSNPFTDGSWI